MKLGVLLEYCFESLIYVFLMSFYLKPPCLQLQNWQLWHPCVSIQKDTDRQQCIVFTLQNDPIIHETTQILTGIVTFFCKQKLTSLKWFLKMLWCYNHINVLHSSLKNQLDNTISILWLCTLLYYANLYYLSTIWFFRCFNYNFVLQNSYMKNYFKLKLFQKILSFRGT